MQAARCNQQPQRLRQHGNGRCNGEAQQANEIHLAVADALTQRRQRQQQAQRAQLVGIDDPDCLGGLGIELLGHRGQGQIHDRAIEYGHNQAQHDHQHREAPLGHGKAVPHGWSRCLYQDRIGCQRLIHGWLDSL
ncbi:hypothetical protein D3C72_1334210 [compost metagenome]